MIKPKADIISLCDKKFTDLNTVELRLIIMNYIYYAKGVIVPEVMTANLPTKEEFMKKGKIAYEYFEQ